MAYVAVEICCSPNGDHKYPVPTTLRIARIFANGTEAAKEFSQDTYYKAESEYAGQDIYYVLWKTDEPLNLDRCVVQDNSINNCGMWMPDSERMYTDVGDLGAELVPPERVKQRAKERTAAERAAQRKERAGASIYECDGGEEPVTLPEYAVSRGRTAQPGASYARTNGGTPWKKFA